MRWIWFGNKKKRSKNITVTRIQGRSCTKKIILSTQKREKLNQIGIEPNDSDYSSNANDSIDDYNEQLTSQIQWNLENPQVKMILTTVINENRTSSLPDLKSRRFSEVQRI